MCAQRGSSIHLAPLSPIATWAGAAIASHLSSMTQRLPHPRLQNPRLTERAALTKL